jgi:putative RNA 2'-phosphotransferase
MPSNDDIQLSKFLSYVLRHKPDSIEIELDKEGWAHVEQLLKMSAKHGKSISHSKLKEIVEHSDKHRFVFSQDGLKIRANQGHSINAELNLEKVVPPQVLNHGTATRFLESIQAQGLLKGARHHVHLTVSKESAILVGKRYGTPILLHIRAFDMHNDGYQFFLSANNVWLTDSVPVGYIDFP